MPLALQCSMGVQQKTPSWVRPKMAAEEQGKQAMGDL